MGRIANGGNPFATSRRFDGVGHRTMISANLVSALLEELVAQEDETNNESDAKNPNEDRLGGRPVRRERRLHVREGFRSGANVDRGGLTLSEGGKAETEAGGEWQRFSSLLVLQFATTKPRNEQVAFDHSSPGISRTARKTDEQMAKEPRSPSRN